MIVVDTHVLIWFIEADAKLGNAARQHIEEAAIDGTIWIPAISVWEIALIEKRDALPFTGGSLAWIKRVLTLPGFTLAPLEPAVATDSVQMAWAHKDPADRIIVATARHLDIPLLTADRTILAYVDTGQVEAIDARL